MTSAARSRKAADDESAKSLVYVLRRDLKDTLNLTTDVVVAVETVVVALTMAVAEGEIVPAAVATAVRAAVVDAVVVRLVTVAAAVVEGIGPAVKTLF